MKIGVLALQGAFIEHKKMIESGRRKYSPGQAFKAA